ncbi:hypothetical protein ACQRIU_002415 [Beauveria bassiana]
MQCDFLAKSGALHRLMSVAAHPRACMPVSKCLVHTTSAKSYSATRLVYWRLKGGGRALTSHRQLLGANHHELGRDCVITATWHV